VEFLDFENFEGKRRERDDCRLVEFVECGFGERVSSLREFQSSPAHLSVESIMKMKTLEW
jgi:hypothetical protein